MMRAYVRFRKIIIYGYIITVLVMLLVNYLYDHPMISISYSLLILTFLLIIFMLIDCMKYLHKLKSLRDVNKHLTLDKQILPDTEDGLEMEYQGIIASLYDLLRNQVDHIDRTNAEQIEYYTMWVHQIKTPISAMRLILQNRASTEASDLLEQELFKIEQYVELALQYTKMSCLSSDLVIREYSLKEIVHQSVRKYAQLFINKRLTVQINVSDTLIITDSKWLSFMIEQLLSNAIKYTVNGGVTIEYDSCTLRITDTGIGIKEEDIERLFEKGYTGYNGRLDKRASGIGLYLTKKVADTLAIKISINSSIGSGTTVSLTFPGSNSLLSKEYSDVI